MGIWNFNLHCLDCYVQEEEETKANHFRQSCYPNRNDLNDQGPSPSGSQPGSRSNEDPLRYLKCLWRCCSFNFAGKSIIQVASHVTHHVTHTRASRCLWNGCMMEFNNPWDLSIHMIESHQVISEYTLKEKARFCHQCAEWCESSHAWDEHCMIRTVRKTNPFFSSCTCHDPGTPNELSKWQTKRLQEFAVACAALLDG